MRKIGIVSGYFNPLHGGHLDYINEARQKCDDLIVIVNNDRQVELKGSKKFMNEQERRLIMSNLKAVKEAFVSIDQDKHVCQSLTFLSEKYENCELTFYNSGDRNHTESPEKKVCNAKNMKTEYLPLPKINSSSALLRNAQI